MFCAALLYYFPNNCNFILGGVGEGGSRSWTGVSIEAGKH